jgi:hypothetical protein
MMKDDGWGTFVGVFSLFSWRGSDVAVILRWVRELGGRKMRSEGEAAPEGREAVRLAGRGWAAEVARPDEAWLASSKLRLLDRFEALYPAAVEDRLGRSA